MTRHKVARSITLDNDVDEALVQTAKAQRSNVSALLNTMAAKMLLDDQSPREPDQPAQEGTCQSNPTS